MLAEVATFFSNILVSILESELGNSLEEKINLVNKQRVEDETVANIEERVKEIFEQEKVKDWLLERQYDIEQAGCLFSEEDKEQFIKDFFEKNKQLAYLGSAEVSNVMYKYLDEINKWANDVLTDESKLTIGIIKHGQNKQTREIIKHLNFSTQEIKKIVEEKVQKEEKISTEERKCPGFGLKKGKCENYIGIKGETLCKRCKGLEFYDRIEKLYRIQNYYITREHSYFLAEQKSGIIKSKAAVFPSYLEKFDSTEICDLMMKINLLTDVEEYEWIHVVTNGMLTEHDKKSLLANKRKIEIFTEQDVINGIMDFSIYLQDIIDEYENGSLCEHYIELYDEENGDLLDFSVMDFLEGSDENALLILGDYGCGKTSFLLNLAYRLAKDYLQNNGEYIPLFIPLKEHAKAINMDNLFLNIFVGKCRMSNISMEAFKLLLKYRKFVILFDGFDEVAKRVNYDIKFAIFSEICKYCIGSTKIIVTCRPNYFQEKREYKALIENAHLQFEPNEANDAEFGETYIAELNGEQIDKYIESFRDELKKNKLDPERVKELIENTHDLGDLSKRPFLLNIIVQTLPKLLTETRDEKASGKLNAATLYKKYTELWLARENQKGKTLINTQDKLHFCIHIAYKLFVDDESSLHYSEFPDEIREYFKDLSRIDEIDYFSQDIQSCSFMSSDGDGYFRFIHKSFMEYFVACHIADGLKKAAKSKKKIDFDSILFVRGISSEVALFVNDILEENNYIYNQVLTILQENIGHEDENIKQNVITILSKMQYNIGDIIGDKKLYVNSDLSRSIIKNVEIEGVDFSNATFYGSTIENVTFIDCSFVGASFQKAVLKNVDFSMQNLEFANFSYAHIEKCNFGRCSLAETNISKATVIENNFVYCDMSGIESMGTYYEGNFNYEFAMGVPYDLC